MRANTALRWVYVGSFLASALLAGCSQQDQSPAAPQPASPPQFKPVASIQELMTGLIDPSADGVWDVVGTTVTPHKIEERQPRTEAEWQTARMHALNLFEATNLLIMDGRRLVPEGGKILDEGSDGVLSSAAGQQRLESQHQTFVTFARALRDVAEQMLQAIDARKPEAMIEAGTALDDVC